MIQINKYRYGFFLYLCTNRILHVIDILISVTKTFFRFMITRQLYTTVLYIFIETLTTHIYNIGFNEFYKFMLNSNPFLFYMLNTFHWRFSCIVNEDDICKCRAHKKIHSSFFCITNSVTFKVYVITWNPILGILKPNTFVRSMKFVIIWNLWYAN